MLISFSLGGDILNEEVEKGYWAVATQKQLNKFQISTPNLEEFDALNNAGKAGRLLGLIRGNTKIENMKKIIEMTLNNEK